MTTGEQFDQATLEAMVINLKAIVEAWQSDSQQQAKQRQTFQDKTNDQYLRFVEDQHTLVMRTADLSASGVQRHRDNLDTLTTLVLSGEIDTTAQGAMGAKMAEEFRSISKQAIESAVGMTAQTSAAAQGTTGVAQAALQTQVAPELAQIILNANTVQTALLSELAKIEQALSVILVKVTGEAVAK